MKVMGSHGSRYSHIGVGCLSRKIMEVLPHPGGSTLPLAPCCRANQHPSPAVALEGNNKSETKGKTEMGHVVWANRLLSMISGCSSERAALVGSLCPTAIGAHIFMLRNRMKRRKKTREPLRPNFI